MSTCKCNDGVSNIVDASRVADCTDVVAKSTLVCCTTKSAMSPGYTMSSVCDIRVPPVLP